MKDLRDCHLKSYQLQTNYIEAIQDRLNSTRQWKKNYPFEENNKYKRMDNELRLEQEQLEFELYRTLQVHLGIFPEDEINKQDATIDSFCLAKHVHSHLRRGRRYGIPAIRV